MGTRRQAHRPRWIYVDRTRHLPHTPQVADCSITARLTMDFDHSKITTMNTMAISKFKATCLAALERVRTSGRPLRVTRFGRPVADIVPPRDVGSAGWIGAMAGTATIVGDIREPIRQQWDALK